MSALHAQQEDLVMEAQHKLHVHQLMQITKFQMTAALAILAQPDMYAQAQATLHLRHQPLLEIQSLVILKQLECLITIALMELLLLVDLPNGHQLHPQLAVIAHQTMCVLLLRQVVLMGNTCRLCSFRHVQPVLLDIIVRKIGLIE
jgi:hypothetical protein